MTRVLLLGLAILIGTASLAHATSGVSRFVFGSGGGEMVSPQHSLRFTVGQDVVGFSGASQHAIGHGFWPPLLHTLTGIEPPQDRPLPQLWKLHTNLPNPFNPRTLIRFDVPAPGASVELTIYDLGGRRVRTLWSGIAEAGTHERIWSGRDETGRPVSSGVYLIVLETPRGRFTNKMTLVR